MYVKDIHYVKRHQDFSQEPPARGKDGLYQGLPTNTIFNTILDKQLLNNTNAQYQYNTESQSTIKELQSLTLLHLAFLNNMDYRGWWWEGGELHLYFPFRKWLNVGTVPMFKIHHVGTVPMFKNPHVGIVPTFEKLNILILKK